MFDDDARWGGNNKKSLAVHIIRISFSFPLRQLPFSGYHFDVIYILQSLCGNDSYFFRYALLCVACEMRGREVKFHSVDVTNIRKTISSRVTFAVFSTLDSFKLNDFFYIVLKFKRMNHLAIKVYGNGKLIVRNFLYRRRLSSKRS